MWKSIRERYQLKWSDDSSINFFEEIYASNNQCRKMIEWVKAAAAVLPKERANILYFNTLTGLRSSEAIESICLIHTDLDNYLNRERMVLEHFRYRDIFIRRTKNAFISVIIPTVLELAKKCAIDCSWSAIYHMLKTKGMNMQMKYCRKIFATYVRSQAGVDSEIVNLLQGRIGKDMFVRHYNRPDLDIIFERVRSSIESLEKLVVEL
jgi:intergrase/recombinase